MSLYSFTGGNDGEYPQAGLVQGSDGYLYGTTLIGGTNGAGTVFKISASGAFMSLYSFTGNNDGGYPFDGLVQGSDGNFYGTTEGGGTNGFGTVFKINASGVLTSLYSFTGGKDGNNPSARLMSDSAGTIVRDRCPGQRLSPARPRCVGELRHSDVSCSTSLRKARSARRNMVPMWVVFTSIAVAIST